MLPHHHPRPQALPARHHLLPTAKPSDSTEPGCRTVTAPHRHGCSRRPRWNRTSNRTGLLRSPAREGRALGDRKMGTRGVTSHPTHSPKFLHASCQALRWFVSLFRDFGIPGLQTVPLPAVGGSQDPHKPLGTEDRTLACSAGLGDQHPGSHVLTPATHNLLLCSLRV